MPTHSDSSPRGLGNFVECRSHSRRSADSDVEPMDDQATPAQPLGEETETYRKAELAGLARRASSGDTDAEARIVEMCHGPALAHAARSIRDRETAREVANDVMLALLLALRKGLVRDLDRLEAFVYGTTLHLVHNRLRHDRHLPESGALDFETTAGDPWPEHERLDQIRQIRRALLRMDRTDRQILTMTLIEGLKPGEIANRLQVSVELVRQRKSRAVKELASWFARDSKDFRTHSPPESIPR
jgi:RNA polymerase sigma factor (sigma-70 family)